MYPTSDALRFEGRPEVVYVYLRVEDFAPTATSRRGSG